nr:cytochrome bd-I oxidase subunit CydX [Paraburkholderia dilworthii]
MWHLIAIPGIGAALGFRIVDAMSLEANGKFAREPQRAATRTEGRSS